MFGCCCAQVVDRRVSRKNPRRDALFYQSYQHRYNTRLANGARVLSASCSPTLVRAVNNCNTPRPPLSPTFPPPPAQPNSPSQNASPSPPPSQPTLRATTSAIPPLSPSSVVQTIANTPQQSRPPTPKPADCHQFLEHRQVTQGGQQSPAVPAAPAGIELVHEVEQAPPRIPDCAGTVTGAVAGPPYFFLEQPQAAVAPPFFAPPFSATPLPAPLHNTIDTARPSFYNYPTPLQSLIDHTAPSALRFQAPSIDQVQRNLALANAHAISSLSTPGWFVEDVIVRVSVNDVNLS